jgi:hypothetical protein
MAEDNAIPNSINRPTGKIGSPTNWTRALFSTITALPA